MSDDPRRNDPRPTGELIDLALTESDEDKRWDLVDILHKRATEEVFEIAIGLCQSTEGKKRTLGADVLNQLGQPDRIHEEDCKNTLLGMLQGEHENDVLDSTLCALGHHQLTAEELKSFMSFKTHSNTDIRQAVASGLWQYSSIAAIQTVIELMSDEDAQVRDWATLHSRWDLKWKLEMQKRFGAHWLHD